MKNIEILQSIGFQGKRAEVYLACLELGKATAYLISRKTNIKKPTVYDLVNDLMQEGILYKTIKNKVTYYYPSDPLALVNKTKEKTKQIESIMPFLQNLYTSSSVKPFIRYFEGKEGIKEIYEDTLRTLKKGDIIYFFMGEGMIDYLPKYAREYVDRRVEKGIVSKGIFRRRSELQEYLENNEKELRITKVLDEKKFPFSHEINIYKNKVAIATYGNEMFGMLIESKEFYLAMKAIFDLAWIGADYPERLQIENL
jgi:HTH-type transcriptional regulator, sugar sensing transcriptional regulator